MEIEHLSKSQIILLTLLISFVTSVATGIVTVSLMDQAPPAIAQTVNRVVERTVEKVVQSAQTAAASPVQTQTVVVKESDLIAQSLQAVSPSLVKLYSSDSENPVFLGFGLVIDKSGTVISDTAALGESSDAVLMLASGAKVRSFVSARDNDAGVAFMRSATSTVDGKPVTWSPATLGKDKPTLGETGVMISGKSVQRIASGIVTALLPLDKAGTSVIIDTSIPSDPIMFGSPLIDTNGAVLGVSTGVARAASASGFMPVPSAPKPPATTAK